MKRPHVILVEASPLFRQALSNILGQLGFPVTVAELHLAKPPKEDSVIVVDVATLDSNAVELGETIRELAKMGPVLLIAREDRIEEVIQGIRGGALGFVRQTASRKDLAGAVKALAAGAVWCDVALFHQIVKYLPFLPHLRRARFTRREADVLTCIRRGEQNKEIAQRLGVTVQSVKVYVSNLLRKTGAQNRNELALAVIDVAAALEPTSK